MVTNSMVAMRAMGGGRSGGSGAAGGGGSMSRGGGAAYVAGRAGQIKVGVLKGHTQPVWQLGFNREDESLVSVSSEQVRVWRVTKE